MAFTTPDFNAIRAAILRDIVNQQPAANTAADGDFALRASASAAAIEGLYQHQAWIARQILPDTADEDMLLRHASLRGLSLKRATAATGTVLFSGTPGSAVPVGTEVKSAAGVAWLTTAGGTVGAGGSVTLAAQASVVGVVGNAAAGTALTLTAAPSGVLSSASVVSMSGGTAAETPAELLARLLFRLRNPPCGGAAHDYYSWALNVDGVTAAWIYPHRRGIGTVDVVIGTAGGLPDAALVAAVQAAIEAQRPVQAASVLVLAPTGVPVPVTGALLLAAGYTLAAVSAAIDAALAEYFDSLKPGDTVYLSRIRGLISATEGVVDFALASPAANVVTTVDGTHVQQAVLGARTWS